jgi:hypothetical protein
LRITTTDNIKMKKTIILTGLLFNFIFSSCKKSTSDYVGVLETWSCTKGHVTDGFNPMASPYRKSNGSENNAKVIYFLDPIKISTYINENDKSLIGEIETDLTTSDNYSISPTFKKKKFKAELRNFHLDNDTLKFTIHNEALGVSNSLKGLIYKGDQLIIGLENKFSGVNEYTDKNPFYLNKTNEMVYYKATSVNEKNKVNDFYSMQYKNNEEKLKDLSTTADAKRVIVNSNKELKRIIEK